MTNKKKHVVTKKKKHVNAPPLCEGVLVPSTFLLSSAAVTTASPHHCDKTPPWRRFGSNHASAQLAPRRVGLPTPLHGWLSPQWRLGTTHDPLYIRSRLAPRRVGLSQSEPSLKVSACVCTVLHISMYIVLTFSRRLSLSYETVTATAFEATLGPFS